MNNKTDGNRVPWRAGALAVMAAVAVLTAACSTATTTTGSAAGQAPTVAQEVALAQCVRAHGMPDFPDPDASGGFSNLTAATLDSSQMQAAYGACRHLLPNGGPSLAGIQAQIQAATQRTDVALVPFAQCMHTHGVPNFPEPPATLKGAGVNPQAPQFQTALGTCRHLLPAGANVTIGTTGEKAP